MAIRISQLYAINPVTVFDGTELVEVVDTNGDSGAALHSDLVKKSVKQYKGLLSFNGTTFTFKSLVNTVGAVVWTNPSNAALVATLTGAFTLNKTFIQPTIIVDGYFVAEDAGLASANARWLYATFYDGTRSSTPTFTDMPVDITVYP